MKKTYIFLLAALGAFLLFSCATTPETVDLMTAQTRATAAREKAQSEKADLAAKAEFATAQAAYKDAEGLLPAGGPSAIEKFLEAERLFLAARDAAIAKRDEARKQLEKAKSDIKAVETEAEALQREQGGAK
ncbi:MAG: hypothetical protein LBT33_01685 [Spirochaetia bacterium]|nr:hypothetical protein [Spirochaetia bacterium]